MKLSTFLLKSITDLAKLLILLVWLTVMTAMSEPARCDDQGELHVPSIAYTLRFPAPETHYVEVEASLPVEGQSSVTAAMAVWTPGSYLVREFARHVEQVRAETIDGERLKVNRVSKNRWEITGYPQEVDRILVRYRVYGREMRVQTNWIDAGFAMLNGAPTYLTLADDVNPRPHEVIIERPESWTRAVSGLPVDPENPDRFRADSYDTLVDSPIYIGNPNVYEFEVDGKRHLLVNEGEGGSWDGPRSAKDVEQIVKAQRDFWGNLPYEDQYVFFNLLVESGGGLEHKNSTILMGSRFATRSRSAYRSWLTLVSHEYFHTWNVKRLRPAALGPFDYETENYTRSLWVAEGITSYYEAVLLRRAGLLSPKEYIDHLSGDIERLQETPGRLAMPVEEASYNAWIKLYRRDENTINTSISYYTKGAVIAFLLDAEIRRATGNQKSLDDLMRLAYQRYSGERGYTPEEFRATAEEVAGTDLDRFFVSALETTEELDYQPALDWFGLRFKPIEPKEDEPEAQAWLGLETSSNDGRMTISQVKRGTPAYEVGLNVNDEILAIGEDRVVSNNWPRLRELYQPGESATLLIARRGRLLRLEATFAEKPRKSYTLQIDPEADTAAVEHRNAWLNVEPKDDGPEQAQADPNDGQGSKAR